MDENLTYLEKLRGDLLEQFRGNPNIEVMQDALSRQLSDVYEFFTQLSTLLVLQQSEGQQLDGIGDIAALSRADALVVSKLAQQVVPMDDETYRLYLAWKINLNTTNCTHRDVYQALRMFWDTPLYYSENPNHPATMFFTTPALSPDVNTGVLLLAPKVKAAGVKMRIVAITESLNSKDVIGVAGTIFDGGMSTILPEYAHD